MPPDFSSTTITAIGKRAAYLCSNPECRASTAGPSTERDDKSILLGEAAHIHGARPGTARYRAEMTDDERAGVINGIWLCRNCHRAVDSDAVAFPAEMLFQWQELHQQYVTELLGKPNELLRLKILQRHADQLGDIPLIAKRIIVEKPEGWEYELTAELLRHYLRPAQLRWSDLRSHLYTKPLRPMDRYQFTDWLRMKLSEVTTMLTSFQSLIDALPRTWGDPGVPGDPIAIDHVCKLFGDGAMRLIEWEEDVAFIHPPDSFDGVKEALVGTVGPLIAKLEGIVPSLEKIVAYIKQGGQGPATFHHEVVFDLPDGWQERISRAFKRAMVALEDE